VGAGTDVAVGVGVGFAITLFAKLQPLSGPANCVVLKLLVDPPTVIHKDAAVGDGVGGTAVAVGTGVSDGVGTGVPVGLAVGSGLTLGLGVGVGTGVTVGLGVACNIDMANPSVGGVNADVVKSTAVFTSIHAMR